MFSDTALRLLSFRFHLLAGDFDLLSQPVSQSSKDDIFDIIVKGVANFRIQVLVNLDLEKVVGGIYFIHPTVKNFISNFIAYFC